MRRKGALALILTICLLFSVAVWKGAYIIKEFLSHEKSASNIIESSEEDSNLRNTVLYYKDDKGYLVPVMRKIPWPEGRGIARAALRALIDNPANRSDIESLGLTPILPANTEIRGISIHDGICKVDFTRDFLNYNDAKEEACIVKGIVYTLTEFPTISKVKIMIDGKEVNSLTYGLKIDKPLARKDINYIGSGRNKNKVIVYYQGTVNGLESYFIPVTKEIDVADNESVTAIRVLESLIEGPPEDSGLFTVIPKNIQVRNVDVVDRVAYVDFSKEIKDIKDSKLASDIVKTIALTLKEYYKKDVALEKVSILAEGEEINFGDISKEEPASIPTFANEY
ncbi:GerMN domain-containing protein [Caminicella sporogenes]|uniref:GerMN domain-containing protein n=1 Tax=Caminicella sporogenes TaxID=166485 RepID=UPI002541711A|nr:GerMN domain-containing protein [Caminicella sporogenes]WIF94078.1 GerMN domain-containing protein [Caminicella sporogenes]